MMRKCEVSGCENKHHAKGFCIKHYWRIRKTGVARLLTKVEKEEMGHDTKK